MSYSESFLKAPRVYSLSRECLRTDWAWIEYLHLTIYWQLAADTDDHQYSCAEFFTDHCIAEINCW